MENSKKETIKEELKKETGWLFTIFACLMTALIVFLASNLGSIVSKLVDPSKKSTNKDEMRDNCDIVTTNDIVGTYETTQEEYVNNDEKSPKLIIYIDGTYSYDEGKIIPSGHMGTYAIVDNNISLNPLITLNAGEDFEIIRNTRIIGIVNIDGSITIPKNTYFEDIDLQFTKTTNNVANYKIRDRLEEVTKK